MLDKSYKTWWCAVPTDPKVKDMWKVSTKYCYVHTGTPKHTDTTSMTVA